MSFVRALLLCIAFAASGVLVPVEHSRAHAQDAGVTHAHDDHGHDHHFDADDADHEDEDGSSSLGEPAQHHGSSSHDADLHFVAIDLTAPVNGVIPFRTAERCFGDCLNRLGPVLPRDPDPERA